MKTLADIPDLSKISIPRFSDGQSRGGGMKKTMLGIGLVFCFLFASYAEFRVWSSQDGSSTIEAQFIQMSGGKAVLEKRDGDRIMVPPGKLSSMDQEYLAGVAPPTLKIKVDKEIDEEKLSEWSGYSSGGVHKRQDITIDVEIRKTNKDKCTQRFKVHLYIIAESTKGDRKSVLKHQRKTVSFTDSNSALISASADCQFYEYSGYSSGHEGGWEYEGYLVIVEDQDGKIIASDTNRSVYESKVSKIRKNSTNRRGFSL